MNKYKQWFKNLSQADQRNYLFNELLKLKLLYFILAVFCIFFMLTNSVKADSSGTYTEYNANTCFNMGYSQNIYFNISSNVNGRMVKIIRTSAGYYDGAYFISLSPGFVSEKSGNSVSDCSIASTALIQSSYDGHTFYYYSMSSIYWKDNVAQVEYNASNLVEAAYRFTYGDLSSDGSTFKYYCSGCNTIIQRTDNKYINFSSNKTNLRQVVFLDKIFFVSTSDFTPFIYVSNDLNPSSCGSNSQSTYTYSSGGITYYLFNWTLGSGQVWVNQNVIQENSSSYLAVRYTFGDLAVAPSTSCSIDYSPVRNIYPIKNNYDIASFNTALHGNYGQIPDSNYLGLYFTRYDKDLDALYSYRLILEDEVNYPIQYSVSNSEMTVTFNNNIFTSIAGVTSIYDNDWFNFYSETNNLSESANYLDSNKWNTYNIAYPDISDADHIQHALTTIFTNSFSRNVYSSFSIPNTLTFTISSADISDYSSLVENRPLYFFTAVNDSENFYDYYLILGFRSDAFSSVVEGFYNYGNTYHTDDGDKVLTASYYHILPYLNSVMMFENYNSDNTVYTVDDYLNGSVDKTKIPQFGEDYIDTNIKFTDEEYITVPAIDAFDTLFSSLTELVRSNSVDNQTILNLIQSNTSYFFNVLRDFENPYLVSNSSWISSELDWVYNNTILSVPINIALTSAVIWAVIF